MARYRIYPTKNTTIMENKPTHNTGRNEVSELWYGVDGITRLLMRFDTEDYVAKYDENLVPHITAITASLVLPNCYPTFESSEYSDAVQASSVNLLVKLVQQDWDEGNGHDFVGYEMDTGYASWYSATSNTDWAADGGDFVYTVFSGHIDKGYENFSGDVTDEIQLWNAFTGTDFGVGIMYSANTEALSADARTVLKFYTRHTNTYNLPYIQFDWDNQVTDQRDEIYTGVSKRLYLYTKKSGTFDNVYSANSVVVTYSASGGVSGWTATIINNPMEGMYYVDYTSPGPASAGTIITDTWNVTYENGMDTSSVVQTGLVKSVSSVWSTDASTVIDPSDYDVSIPDIKPEYKQGSRVFLEVQNLTNYTTTKNVLKTMEYWVYLKDGILKTEMIPWEGVSYTQDENFIMFDTQWFITGCTYGVEFRYNVDGALIYTENERTFKVV